MPRSTERRAAMTLLLVETLVNAIAHLCKVVLVGGVDRVGALAPCPPKQGVV